VSVFDTADGVRRWIGKGLGRFAEDRELREPSTGEIWDGASPLLEKGLEVYDKGRSESTPNFTLNPFGDSKASCQKELEQILDKLLQILGLSGAARYRNQIRTLQSEIADSKMRIGEYRQRLISAPSEKSLNLIEGIWIRSREGLEEQVELERETLARKSQQVEESKSDFREYLKNIGVTASPESADAARNPMSQYLQLPYRGAKMYAEIRSGSETPNQRRRFPIVVRTCSCASAPQTNGWRVTSIKMVSLWIPSKLRCCSAHSVG
jgi:hypothetical protein